MNSVEFSKENIAPVFECKALERVHLPDRSNQKEKRERGAKCASFPFWWTRPVTAHSHEKDYMDRVGKISVAPVIARKIIEGY